MNKVKIEKLIPGGMGLGTLSSGKKVMLWNALPGEIITDFKTTKEKSSFIEGIATHHETYSEFRIEPKDPCYLATSPWQNMEYDYELDQKKQILIEIFCQQGIDINDFNFSVQTDGKDYFYRNKMEYSLYYSHEDMKIHPAFRGRGSHQKIPVTQSSIERSEIWQVASEIIADMNQRQLEARNFQSLLLRCNGNGEVSGGLFENKKPHPIFNQLSDQILGYTYSYSPNGFFQINLPVYEMVLTEIKKYINAPKVLDLYSGVGTIGLSVARDCDLTLVECDKSAYRELEHNAANISTAKTIYARSEEALEYISPDQVVILDPPRAGCDIKLLEKLLSEKPETIIYLSCNPITQARDAKILSEKYQLKLISPYNFFPRTPHLENLIVLKSKL